MSAEYSEDRLVQQTTANFFEQTLGWQSVYAFDSEKYGARGTLGRTSQTEVILTRYLRQAIEQFNPGHSSTAYDDAIEKFLYFNLSQSLLQINQEKYKLLRDGIRVSYRTATGELREPLLRVIDFDNPDNNHFLIVRELWIKGTLYPPKRPDIIGFVNGIPLLFIELKKSCRDVRVAYDDNFTRYKTEIPHLFYHNAIVMLSNGIDAKVGTITSPYKFFHEWRRLTENEKGRVHFETMLRGMCSKQNFLDLVQNFILFDNSSGTTYKILARNHQFLGVNRAFQAVKDREIRSGKLGVFWHTQGSGKSYSMAFLTEKVHRLLSGSFTFLLVTDRQELDKQIVQTFAGVGAIPNDSTQANNGDHLDTLLKQNNRYACTLIHKFNKPNHTYSDRPNIIVLCDEAHRTQYGTLAGNMRNGLEKASFIAFTGTPLMQSEEDQKTREFFGDYISTYDFQRAVEDGSTVPLYYDNRGEKLRFVDQSGNQQVVARPDELNQRIADELAKLDLDEEAEERVLRRIGNDYLILTADSRLDRIAEDLVAHYTTRWQTGKAMLVCLDKLTAVRMYNLIHHYWQQAIANQTTQVIRATNDQDLIGQQQYLAWLQATEYAVVVSEAANENKTFDDWGLDIRPHRSKMQSRHLEEDFKNENHPFRLAIVCAMWLTGFDVPSLATLYMDKPMQGHSLMQAIARANRVAEGKNNGLLIDYNGILKSLRTALAKYAKLNVVIGDDSDDQAGIVPYKDLEQLRDNYAEAIQTCSNHLASLGFDLEELIQAEGFDKLALLDKENQNSAVNAVCTNDESRARFEVMSQDVFNKKQALITEPRLTEPFQPQHNAIEAVYNQLNKQQELAMDLNAVLRALHGVISKIVTVETSDRLPGADSGKLYNISEINFERLEEEFAGSKTKNIQVQTLKKAVEQQLERMLRRNPCRIDLYTHYQQIIEDYNRETERATIEQTFEQLLQLISAISEEDSRADREGLNEENLAVFDLLCRQKNNLSARARNQVKEIAYNLIEAIKAKLRKLDNWRGKEKTKAKIQTLIYNYLYSDKTGLPLEEYDESEVAPLANAVFLHIYQQYPSADQNPYSDAA
ncbi:type I site-specific deoxyribonuclease, HsdR family (plasmid) [Crinalium epipsammum PCC 9333]|uniref:Type I restriction enzyme endonuclease subunit n=1 Tax=Crinalium epipsammum PCC 9333 TaxID=1173022 RepID=K9W5Y9_9CYAN|nr:type I restriction endonuclease subunit R [Crinalium epipsammum]AFZ15591.1 type I site-specific deoxyribonuclease, HsdR family [Crinalium epipsammum PCC 9333]